MLKRFEEFIRNREIILLQFMPKGIIPTLGSG